MIRARCILASLVFAGANAFLPVPACAGWRVVGQVGGPVSAVAVRGTTAYVAVGLRLHVYEISDPSAPLEVASTGTFGDFISDVELDGTRAYVTAGKDGLHILDVSDPANPREIAVSDTPGSAEGIAIGGTVAYVADGPFGLQIVDVSDPTAPRLLSTAFDTFFAFDVIVSGPVAYVAAAGAGVLVVDVQDPSQPRELPIVDTPGYARGLTVSNTTLYVADQWGGVRVMNVSSPLQPRETGSISLQSWAFAVAISGPTLYVAGGSAGLHVFDVADHERPLEISMYDVPWNLSWKIAVASGRAFLGVRTQGVKILDIRNPSLPRLLGSISPLSNAQAVAVRGTLAFVATESQGMRIVDLEDVREPRERGRGGTADVAWAVAADDRHVYTCEGSVPNHYLRVFDVSNPDRPALLASPRIPQGHCRDLMVKGTSLYMPDEFALEIWDVSIPSIPLLRGKLDFAGGGVDRTSGVEAVDVIGPTAFVDRERGVSAIDVSDSRNPRLLGSWSTESLVFDLTADEESVYAIGGGPFPQLYVLNASDPAQLTLTGVTSIAGPGARVIARDKKAYVAAGAAGVAVIDATNPAAPVQTERIQIPGFAKELTFAGDRLVVAAANTGVLIFEQTPAPSLSVPHSAENGRETRRSIPPSRLQRPAARRTSSITSAVPRISLSAGRTVVVTSTADSGAGTLREALANLQSGDVITFHPPVFPSDAPATIRPQSALPRIQRNGIVIDASNAGVILDGSALPGRFDAGLEIHSRENTIKGLQIINFPNCGICIYGQGGNVIGGDRSSGSGPSGEGNVISRNGEAGIGLGLPNGNRIVGNLIGTDVTGTQGLGQQRVGVSVFSAKEDVTGPDRIGGSEPWEANVIAGNDAAEVYLHNARGQVVIGNFLGTDRTGSFRVGSGLVGVATSFAAGNVISGNVMVGEQWALSLIDSGSHCNLVANNWIGITKSGIPLTTHPYDGIVAIFDPFNAIVGNTMSVGISIADFRSNPAETVVIGNTIGGGSLPENSPGSQAAVNIGSAWRTFIGGATTEERNHISGKTTGIWISTPGIDRTFILGNTIRNTVTGIDVGSASSSVIQRNTIADNQRGVTISSPTNRLRGNSIYANGVAITIEGDGVPAPPIITDVTLNTVRGTSCAQCVVEIYSDAGMQGRWYEGSVAADATGAFSFTTTGTLRGPHLTATATDADASTSTFSAAVARPPVGPRRRAARH